MEAGPSTVSDPPLPIKLLSRIYHKLKTNTRQELIDQLIHYKKQYGFVFNDAILQAANLTGLHPIELHRTETKIIEIPELDRGMILSELHEFYLEKNIIPTTRDLFDALQGKMSPYITISELRTKLALMDFVWKKIPNYTFVVIERPEVVYERYKYLKRLLEYHEQRKQIYFVDEIEFDDCPITELNNKKLMYALSINKVLYDDTVTALDKQEAKRFIRHAVLSAINGDAVIVLKNSQHFSEKYVKSKPSFDSLRRDLIEWLKRYNVPYSNEMSKAELYSLVEKCTDEDDNIYVIDNIISASGHTVLRMPDHIDMLTPTTLFSNYILENLKFIALRQFTLLNMFDSVTEETMTYIFGRIFHELTMLLKNDVEVDNVLDSLTDKMANCDGELKLEDSDVPSLSDSE